jgi:hypothetical protein
MPAHAAVRLTLMRASKRQCNTSAVEEPKFVIGGRNPTSRRFALVRVPDGLTLSAGAGTTCGPACPEFNVPWRNVEFEDDTVRDQVLKAWATIPTCRSDKPHEHPLMPLSGLAHACYAGERSHLLRSRSSDDCP